MHIELAKELLRINEATELLANMAPDKDPLPEPVNDLIHTALINLQAAVLYLDKE